MMQILPKYGRCAQDKWATKLKSRAARIMMFIIKTKQLNCARDVRVEKSRV